MKTKVNNSKKLPKVKIENGIKYVHNGKYYSFSGVVNTIDSFHNYHAKQNIKYY